MLSIQLDSPVPLTDQLRMGIRHAIATGELAPGDPLPTVRQLAGDLGINLNTVARAYRLLETEGLVRTLRGRGTTVTSAQEAGGASPETIVERLRDTARKLLADARLAGIEATQVRALIDEEANAIWPKES